MTHRIRTECRFLMPSSAFWDHSAVKMTSKFRLTVCRVSVLLIFVTLPPIAYSADRDVSRHGPFRQENDLQDQLEQRRSVTVKSVPLRDLLLDLQSETGICIFLDRRIDPSSRMSLNTPLVRTDELLRMIAKELPEAGVSIGYDLVYVGPRNCTKRFRTLVECNRATIRSSHRAFLKETYSNLALKSELRWDDLASPRDIVSRLTADVGLAFTNPQDIPHDLWPGGQLPSLSFVESVTLLLLQFDLTFEVQPEGNTCRVVEIPDDILIEKRHSIPREKRESARSIVETRLPELSARWTKTEVRFRGTVEEHEQVAELLRRRSENDHADADESLKTRLLTLSIPAGVTYRQVIAQLQQAGIRIRDEAGLGEKLDTAVTVNLRRLPGERFFSQLFQMLPVTVDVLDDEVVLRTQDDEKSNRH